MKSGRWGMSDHPVDKKWIELDEAKDVAGSIRHVLRTAPFVDEDRLAWKWVILALHSALQGSCVCHLATTASPVGAVTDRNAGEWLAYFEKRGANPKTKRPTTHLMALPDLLKAVRKPRSAGDRSNTAGVSISDSELIWLRRFHDDIRNPFVHFEPMGWSVDVSGVSDIAKLIVRIIEEILETGWAFRHQDFEEREKMLQNLRGLKQLQWPN